MSDDIMFKMEKTKRRWGYWHEWTGACLKVEILKETTDGCYLIETSMGIPYCVDKDEVLEERSDRTN